MFNNAAAANPFEAASNLGQKRGMGDEQQQEEHQYQQQYQQEQHAHHPEMPGFKRRMTDAMQEAAVGAPTGMHAQMQMGMGMGMDQDLQAQALHAFDPAIHQLQQQQAFVQQQMQMHQNQNQSSNFQDPSSANGGSFFPHGNGNAAAALLDPSQQHLRHPMHKLSTSSFFSSTNSGYPGSGSGMNSPTVSTFSTNGDGDAFSSVGDMEERMFAQDSPDFEEPDFATQHQQQQAQQTPQHHHQQGWHPLNAGNDESAMRAYYDSYNGGWWGDEDDSMAGRYTGAEGDGYAARLDRVMGHS